jgi:hypothetical protein
MSLYIGVDLFCVDIGLSVLINYTNIIIITLIKKMISKKPQGTSLLTLQEFVTHSLITTALEHCKHCVLSPAHLFLRLEFPDIIYPGL